MKWVSLKYKLFAFVAVVMSLMVFAMPILAQQDEFTAGRIAGEHAAKAATNGTLWLAVGCLGWVPGLVAAYVYQPVPPATQLLGKSPEYIASYTDAYKANAKRMQVNRAWIGCIASSLVYIAASVAYALEDDSGNYEIDVW